ncbi:MAG TPA: type II toxin-antitoxin system VapC family toxin, partial [Hansschlegelia sp.]
VIVLDTNVISEIMRPADKRSTAVFSWLRSLDPAIAYTTSVSVAEIETGIHQMPQGRRRDDMASGAGRVFSGLFGGRILPFDADAARHYAPLMAARRPIGRHHEHVLDLQIAAIARSRDCAVATRNVSDFADAGVPLINPWDHPAP